VFHNMSNNFGDENAPRGDDTLKQSSTDASKELADTKEKLKVVTQKFANAKKERD